jgi:hypothetical protein
MTACWFEVVLLNLANISISSPLWRTSIRVPFYLRCSIMLFPIDIAPIPGFGFPFVSFFSIRSNSSEVRVFYAPLLRLFVEVYVRLHEKVFFYISRFLFIGIVVFAFHWFCWSFTFFTSTFVGFFPNNRFTITF